MRKDLTLQEVISYIVSDLSVKYRLTTSWDCSQFENEDVNDFYKFFKKDFEKINNELGKLENRMVYYWEKEGGK